MLQKGLSTHRLVLILRLYHNHLTSNLRILANIRKIRLVEENWPVLVANDAHSHSRAVARCTRVGLAEIVRFDFDLQNRVQYMIYCMLC